MNFVRMFSQSLGLSRLSVAFVMASAFGLHAQTAAETAPPERTYSWRHDAACEVVVLDLVRGVVEVKEGAETGGVSFETVLRIQQKPSAAGAPPAAEAPREGDYERAFARLAPRHEAVEGEARLRLRDPDAVVFDWDPTLAMSIQVNVVVPRGTRLRVRSEAAGVAVRGNFAGAIEVRSENGAFYGEKLGGDLIGRSRGGGFTVQEIGGRAELRTDTGLILVGRLRGPAELRTANGGVEVQRAEARLMVRGADADFVIGVVGPRPAEYDLRTSAGFIRLDIDRDAALTLEADPGTLGKVRTRGLEFVRLDGGEVLPEGNYPRLRAAVNGGGALARVRASGGTIALVGRDPLGETAP
jgi:hypothetical protein